MPRSRHVALCLVLGLLAGTGCEWDLGPLDVVCLHSEGCTEGRGETDSRPLLGFSGLVTSAVTGEPLAGVIVVVELPVRTWTQMSLTDSAGRYLASGIPGPAAGDCNGLSVTFSKVGYQPVRVTDFIQLICAPGVYQVNTGLTPAP